METGLHQVALSGVDRRALREFTGAERATGRGAPGATSTLATSTPAVLTGPLATAGFQTLGVTWRPTRSEPDLVISVRTRGARGWTPWTRLDAEEGDDPAALAAMRAPSAQAPSVKAPSTQAPSAPSTQAPSAEVPSPQAPSAPAPSTRAPSTRAPSAEVASPQASSPRQVAAQLRGGTHPLWAGPSDGVQVRVVVRSGVLPADLRLELVDPGRSSHDAQAVADVPPGVVPDSPSGAVTDSPPGVVPTGGPGVVPTGGPGGAMRAGEQAAAAEHPNIVRMRSNWGADDSKLRCPPSYQPTVQAAVLHHTAGPNTYSAAQVPAILRGDYRYHLSRGWCDIGYNALVDRFGRIWEGRAGGLDRAVTGAHAGGFNTGTFGVAMIGNYDVARPSAAAVAAVARIVAWKLELNHRNPQGTARLTSAGGGTSRYGAGRSVALPVIMGHRHTGYTACPGRYLQPQLGAIRNRVRALMKAALINPTGAPASVLRGTPVSLTARALEAQTWRLDVTAASGGSRVARITGSARSGREILARWNGRLSDGSPARPGRYRLELTSRSGAGPARPVTDDVLVVPPAPAPEVPATPSAGPGGYHPVTPARLLDTRTGGNVGLGPDGRVDVPVLGRAGVPATGVTSVVLNLTASGASDHTSIRAWPTGRRTNRPLTGVPAGLTRSVLVTTRVGASGAVSVGNDRGVLELAVDVVGYFAAGGSALEPVPSTRLYDSRRDPAGRLVAGAPRTIPLPASLGGVPAARITGLVLDVSALSPAGAGSLTVHRPGTAGHLPTLHHRKGESIDNLAFVPVDAGSVALTATGPPVHAVMDVRAVLVAGPGSAFTAVKPVLALDTLASPLRAGGSRTVAVTGSRTGVPAGARAVVVALTALDPSAGTWLQVHPAGGPAAGGTALRVAAGDTRANLVVVPVGAGGAIVVTNARGSTRARVDVHGYLQ